MTRCRFAYIYLAFRLKTKAPEETILEISLNPNFIPELLVTKRSETTNPPNTRTGSYRKLLLSTFDIEEKAPHGRRFLGRCLNCLPHMFTQDFHNITVDYY